MIHQILNSTREFFSGASHAVKLDSDIEKAELWGRHSDESKCVKFYDGVEVKYPRYKWSDSLSGKIFEIGSLYNRPITVNAFIYEINHRKIAVVTNQSQLVDHLMIDNWLEMLGYNSFNTATFSSFTYIFQGS